MVYEEGGRTFDFRRAVHSEKFDDNRHRLSHCMSAVDFVVELEKALLLIEVKNVNRGIRAQNDCAKYLRKIAEGSPFIDPLVRKFRDTLLYLHCEERVVKPIRCIVYLELPKDAKYPLAPLTSLLSNSLPLLGTKRTGRWKRELAESAAILDRETWNRIFDLFPVV